MFVLAGFCDQSVNNKAMNLSVVLWFDRAEVYSYNCAGSLGVARLCGHEIRPLEPEQAPQGWVTCVGKRPIYNAHISIIASLRSDFSILGVC